MPLLFKQTTLPNGLQIAGEVLEDAHTAAIGFFVKTGARDELSRVMGVSHFLEHMMFKGSETLSAEDVDRQFDEIGATHNAFTSSEMTAFWAHCLPEHLPRAQEILADILRPALRQEDFDNEKSVILEEIAMYADQPFWVLYERVLEEYYLSHPLSHRVLGTNQSITDLNRDEMVQYFENRYSADNTVVALAGNFDFDEMAGLIEVSCQSWNTSQTQRQYPQTSHEVREFTIETETVHRNYTVMICPGPSMTDPRRYGASMLSSIIGDVEGSRFYWSLIETGLAEEAEVSYEGRDGLGEYLIYCMCDPTAQNEVERIIAAQLDGLIDSLTEDDLSRVRAKVATSVTLHGELPAGRMRRLGRVWTYSGEYRSLEEELDHINAVTLDDLREIWEAFPLHPVVTGRLSPKK